MCACAWGGGQGRMGEREKQTPIWVRNPMQGWIPGRQVHKIRHLAHVATQVPLYLFISGSGYFCFILAIAWWYYCKLQARFCTFIKERQRFVSVRLVNIEAHKKVCTRYSALLILILYYFMQCSVRYNHKKRQKRGSEWKKKSLLYLQVLKLRGTALSTRLYEKDTILVRGRRQEQGKSHKPESLLMFLWEG